MPSFEDLRRESQYLRDNRGPHLGAWPDPDCMDRDFGSDPALRTDYLLDAYKDLYRRFVEEIARSEKFQRGVKWRNKAILFLVLCNPLTYGIISFIHRLLQ